mmetsp:Transcript_2555/g.4378  ORF Transcript_2555/g.4378 Transcript_2555/m.4378 type:complete len:313 (-) Transcript_2555:65-1003(-)
MFASERQPLKARMGGGKNEDEIVISAQETAALTSDQDPTLDPLDSGFTWYKPAVSLSTEHKSGGHTWAISGDDMQILTSTVPAGGEFVTEVGSFVFMHPGMSTSVELTLCGAGGCCSGCRRVMGGERCVKLILKNSTHDEGYVGVTPNFPAKIIPVKFGSNVPSGTSLIARQGAYMSEIGGVDVGCDFDCNCCTSCCGGLGTYRQKLAGSDDSIAFLNAGGTIMYRTLLDGERIIVDSTSVLAIEESVQIGLTPNGRLCTCCCGGEGCCSTTLVGPGLVYMQSMNFLKFQQAVQITVNEEEMDRGADVQDFA